MKIGKDAGMGMILETLNLPCSQASHNGHLEAFPPKKTVVFFKRGLCGLAWIRTATGPRSSQLAANNRGRPSCHCRKFILGLALTVKHRLLDPCRSTPGRYQPRLALFVIRTRLHNVE